MNEPDGMDDLGLVVGIVLAIMCASCAFVGAVAVFKVMA